MLSLAVSFLPGALFLAVLRWLPQALWLSASPSDEEGVFSHLCDSGADPHATARLTPPHNKKLVFRPALDRALLLCFALGVTACLPALFIERGLRVLPWQIGSFGALVLFIVMVVACVEEAFKYLALHLGCLCLRFGDEEYDVLLCAVAVSLGFATGENALFCLRDGLATAWLRAFTAVPAHFCFGIVLGSAVAVARARRRVRWSQDGIVLGGYLAAVAAHAGYDLLAVCASRSSPPLLILVSCGGLAWSVWRLRAAWRCSPSWGGRARLPSPRGFASAGSGGTFAPYTPGVCTQPAARQMPPWLVGLFGVVPGFGQLLNGQPSRAAFLAFLTTFNALLFLLARLFSEEPAPTLRLLYRYGVGLALSSVNLDALRVQREMWPPVTLAILVAGVSVGAVDAWLCARVPSRNASCAPQGLIASYVGHVALLCLLLFTPLLALPEPTVRMRVPASDESICLTWVKRYPGEVRFGGPPSASARASARSTTVVTGSQSLPLRRGVRSLEPPVAGSVASVARASFAIAHASSRRALLRRASPPDRNARGLRVASTRLQSEPIIDVPVPPVLAEGGGPSVPSTDSPPSIGRAGGAPLPVISPAPTLSFDAAQSELAAYNAYLTACFHAGHAADYFFHHVGEDVWVIVTYDIDADGTLDNAQVVDTSGTASQAARVITVLHRCAPFMRLPPGVPHIIVTELFWAQEFTAFTPGSLAEALSHVPDGREIRE